MVSPVATPRRGRPVVAERAPPSTGVQTTKVTADEAGMRVDRFVEARFPGLAFSHIQRIIRKGELRVNGKRAQPKQRLEAGQAVRIPPLRLDQPRPSGRDANVRDQTRAFLKSITLHEDADVLVLNKPMGLAVQGGSGTTRHLDGMLEALRDAQGQRPRRFRLGNHPGVASLMVSALVLWMLGFPDRAAERARRAVALATELGHPFTMAYALFHSGFLHLWRREPETVRDLAERLLLVAGQHDLQLWKALGMFLLGAANTGIGDLQEGLDQIRHGLDLYRGLKTPPVFWPLLLYVHADACARSGRPADGLGMIDEAIEIAGPELTLLPEFYLLKGDLLLAVPGTHASDAESWFRRAFDMAKRLDARMSQLRAAVRLCRLSHAQGKAEEGDRALQATYETFTEGDATADLSEARELLHSQLPAASTTIRRRWRHRCS